MRARLATDSTIPPFHYSIPPFHSIVPFHRIYTPQNNHEERRKKLTKQFYRNLLVGNLEKLAKNRQVCLICHINVKRNQETGNRQTDKQTEYCNPRAHARRALTSANFIVLCIDNTSVCIIYVSCYNVLAP